ALQRMCWSVGLLVHGKRFLWYEETENLARKYVGHCVKANEVVATSLAKRWTLRCRTDNQETSSSLSERIATPFATTELR
uniref:Uncharacterized protein n=1 Tax=Parascaris univalens TaxID=6257 RepID=A0A915A5M7_PARUN